MKTIALSALLCLVALSAHAESYTVRTTEDSGPGSLRDALDDADDGDIILFGGDVRGEIRLSEPLDVNDDVAIKGPGADVVTIRAGAEGSAVDVRGDATISGVTISGGESGIDLKRGKLTLIECAVRNADGPGVEVSDGTRLTLSRSLIADNGGAGIDVGDGKLTCVNSTISGNGAAGLANGDGSVTAANCTIASNRGAGVKTGEGEARLHNTLLADNHPSCSGTIASAGYNLVDDQSCHFAASGDQNGVDPRLGVLYGNGGPTATQAPGGSSPAIDAGDPAGCLDSIGSLLNVDQRGLRRPNGGRCDIGAVETQVATASGGTVVNRILALVDGDPITLYELTDFAAADVRLRESGADQATLLDLLVTKRVIEKEVESQGIAVNEAEIDRYITSIRERNGLDEQQLDQALAQQGLTRERYREQVKEELQRAQLINREIRGKVSVSPEEIDRYYKEHESGATDGEQMVVSHIVLQIPPDASEEQIAAVEARADKIHDELDDGADFAEVAKRESEDGAAPSGGKLGTFKKGEMRDELEAAVKDLDAGEYSEPVRTATAIHIVRLDERIAVGGEGGEGMPDSAREEIKERLYAEALEERYNRWLKEDLRQRHHVEIRQ
jgi:peptidyl-prolyl cis-trans isomerase SurA